MLHWTDFNTLPFFFLCTCFGIQATKLGRVMICELCVFASKLQIINF